LVSQSRGATAGGEAERLFEQSLALARRQQAPAWELRTAMSLSRLTRDPVRGRAPASLLMSVYEKFTEGYDSADLVAAKRLLDELASVSGP
jgi:predicted ATPase